MRRICWLLVFCLCMLGATFIGRMLHFPAWAFTLAGFVAGLLWILAGGLEALRGKE